MSSVKANRGKRGGKSSRPSSSGLSTSAAPQIASSSSSAKPTGNGRSQRRFTSPRVTQTPPAGAKKSARSTSSPLTSQTPPTGRKSTPNAAKASAAPLRRKRSNGDVLLHYLQQDSSAPKKAALSAPSAPATSRQVHYPSLPASLRSEDALRALLLPFGRINEVDMNYVGRGALVTFARADSADNAIQGALMENGKLLKGQHPAPVKRGRGLDSNHPLRPSLGRHNMDEEDVAAIDHSNRNNSRRMQQDDFEDEDEDQQIEEDDSNYQRSGASPPNDDEEDYSADFDDQVDDANMDEEGDYDDVDNNSNGDSDHGDFDEPEQSTPPQTFLKSRTQPKGLQSPHSSIAENARSTLLQWQPVSDKQKPRKEFGRFGSSINAMDVDDTAEDVEEEPISRKPIRSHFAKDDPTKNQPLSITPSVFKSTISSRSTAGPPTAIGREMAQRLAAQSGANDAESTEEQDEEDENMDGDGNGHSGLGNRFNGNNTNDSDDFDSGHESEGETGDQQDENEEVEEVEAESENGEASDENGMNVEDEEDGEDEAEHMEADDDHMDSDVPKSSFMPVKNDNSMKADRKPLTRRPASGSPPPASIAALAPILNPQSNPGKLEAAFDPDKQLWHQLLEQNDDKRAVSSFQRPAGGDDIPPPERVRTVPWLYKAFLQAEKNASDAEKSHIAPRLEIYNYLLNRFRQILKELTQQSTMCFLSCYIAETIARRTLRMRAEILMETSHVDLANFDTGRQKVLDNAFEMCKNLYTFYNQHDLRSPFSNEILSYYLLYRLLDGVPPAWTTVLDSLATVYTRPGTRRSSAEYRSFLASLRCDPHIDFVIRVCEILSSHNTCALRSLASHASFLQLCSLADLLPEFVYFAIDHYFTSTIKATRPPLPSSYLQYHYFLRHDEFVPHLPSAFSEEPFILPKGPSMAIAAGKDDFYPLPADAVNVKGKKKRSSADESYLPTDQMLWRNEREEVMKLLNSIAPTFLYCSTAEPSIDPTTALQVHLRWADSNLIELGDESSTAAWTTFNEDQPLQNPGSYVIPENPNQVSALYAQILDRHFSNGSLKYAPSLTSLPSVPKVIPPPPKRSAATIPSLPAPQTEPIRAAEPQVVPSVSTPASIPVIPKTIIPPASPKVNTSFKPIIKQSGAVLPKSTDKPATALPIENSVAPSPSPAPLPAVTVPAAAAVAAAPSTAAVILPDFEAKIKDFEAVRDDALAKIQQAQEKLRVYTELFESRQAYASRSHALKPAPAASSEMTPDPINKGSALEIPSIVGSRLLHNYVQSRERPPLALTFKLLVSISDSLDLQPGSTECWLESKLSYPSSINFTDESRCVKTLVTHQSSIDLSPENPFNENVKLEDFSGESWASHPPMLSTIVKNVATAQLSNVSEADRVSVKGSTCLLFFIHSSQSGPSYWASQRDRLRKMLSLLPQHHRIPIMIIYIPHASISDLTIRQTLLRDLEYPIAPLIFALAAENGSAFNLNSMIGELEASVRLEAALSELSTHVLPDESFRSIPLGKLIEPHINPILARTLQEYRQALEKGKNQLPVLLSSPQQSGDLSSLVTSLPSSSTLAYAWNELLGSVWQTTCNDLFLSVFWPAPETVALFPFLKDYGWPDANWNSQISFDHLSQFIQSFIIDDSIALASLSASPDWFDLETVNRFVRALIESHPRLEGFYEHASVALHQFKERLDAANLMTRKTGHIPVSIPFSWHSLFEMIFAFLIQQLSQEQVCLPEKLIPLPAEITEALITRRDRQRSEADTWRSWYQSLCPTVEEIRNKELRRNTPDDKKNGQKQFSALLGQFSPVSSPTPSRGLSFVVPPSPLHRDRELQAGSASSTPYRPSSVSSALSPLPFSLSANSPAPKASSSSSTPSRSQTPSQFASITSPSAKLDGLQDRLKSIQDSISRMSAPIDEVKSRNRQQNPKRKADTSTSYASDPPEAKRSAPE